jgi:hypothetical protein
MNNERLTLDAKKWECKCDMTIIHRWKIKDKMKE